MYTRKFVFLSALSLLTVALMAVAVLANPPRGNTALAEGLTLTGTVASKISYQGRLTDAAGNPLNGNYDLVFQLWNDATGGSQVGSNIVRNDVPVSNGLFTVELDVPYPHDVFNGQALWLRIQVEGQWLSPRQALLPVPYALSLRPGARIEGSITESDHTNSALAVINHGIGAAISAQGAAIGIDASAETGSALIGDSRDDYGVVGRTAASDMSGVFGDSSDGIGVKGSSMNNYGVSGQSYASTGVVGSSTNGVGVDGSSTNGVGVSGRSTSSFGVDGFSSNGVGVRGRSTTQPGVSGRSDNQHGVIGWTGASGPGEISGVFGYSTDGVGVTGRSTNYNGIKAVTKSSEHAALAAGNEGAGPAIYAAAGTNGVAAIFSGNVQVRSRSSGATIIELGEGLDYAEGFDVSDEKGVSPGTVLVIDPENPGELKISDRAYDAKVAGIVAGAQNLGSAVRLGVGQFDYDVALAGRVYCNVDASFGEVRPGDLLVTSPHPGYAMIARDMARAQGAVLGKAMEPLAAGEKGQILVLVTLQ